MSEGFVMVARYESEQRLDDNSPREVHEVMIEGLGPHTVIGAVKDHVLGTATEKDGRFLTSIKIGRPVPGDMWKIQD
jgi:hypothetical protein